MRTDQHWPVGEQLREAERSGRCPRCYPAGWYGPETLSHQKKHIQLVKEFNYTVDATDGFDLNTTTGKIHNANIFIRHNKRYKLDEGVFNTTILPHGQNDGSDFDTKIDGEITGLPKPGRRLYMCIRAFAPERVDGATGINALTDPSYDMILRNAVTKV